MKIGLIFPNKDRRYKNCSSRLWISCCVCRKKHEVSSLFISTHARREERKQTDSLKQNLILSALPVYSPVYYEAISVFERLRNAMPKTRYVWEAHILQLSK